MNQRPEDTNAPPGLIDTLQRIASGAWTPEAAIDACLALATTLEPRLHAFAFLACDATSADDGPLRGVAVAVKDLYSTADMPTACGLAVWKDRRTQDDAALVTRLRDLGATIVGKSVTTQFAWRTPGPTGNPWNLAHTPGGSSSGSAAAVAAGIVALALGSQTFGSIVRPAAFCGIVGFKPGHGVLPLAGIQPLAPSLDHPGLLTRSAADAACAFDLLMGETKPLPALPARPRMALLRTPFWERMDEEAQAMLLACADALRAAECIVTEIDLPGYEAAGADATIVLACEAAAIYGPLLASEVGIGQPIRDLVAQGSAFGSPALASALERRKLLQEDWRIALAPYDAVLTPATLGTAPEGLQATGDPLFCTPWSFVGFPALTLPRMMAQNGLPLGMQLVAGPGQDRKLLSAGIWIETAIPSRMPPCPL